MMSPRNFDIRKIGFEREDEFKIRDEYQSIPIEIRPSTSVLISRIEVSRKRDPVIMRSILDKVDEHRHIFDDEERTYVRLLESFYLQWIAKNQGTPLMKMATSKELSPRQWSRMLFDIDDMRKKFD